MRPETGTEDDEHGPARDHTPCGRKVSEPRVSLDRTGAPAAIDPACQRLRLLVEYADRLPSGRRGKRLNRATLWRWALRGLRGGRRLRTVTAGSTRVTCDAWVWEFLGGVPIDSRYRGRCSSSAPYGSVARRLNSRSPERES